MDNTDTSFYQLYGNVRTDHLPISKTKKKCKQLQGKERKQLLHKNKGMKLKIKEEVANIKKAKVKESLVKKKINNGNRQKSRNEKVSHLILSNHMSFSHSSDDDTFMMIDDSLCNVQDSVENDFCKFKNRLISKMKSNKEKKKYPSESYNDKNRSNGSSANMDKHKSNRSVNSSINSSQRNHQKQERNITEEVKQTEVPVNGKFLDPTSTLETTNPIENAQDSLNWLLQPFKQEHFIEDFWEKKPLYIDRPYFKYHIASLYLFHQVLQKYNIQYTEHLDITSYTNGKRETHNPVGRAYPDVVWDYYLNDCSVRMLNPQTYFRSIRILCSSLQDFFDCMVGANIYITPPKSQGFAPHYDDIEAFILQLDGSKRWRLYPPRNVNEYLPRYSSRDFTQEEIGKPFMDIILKKGDFLYLPRGVIHQCDTLHGSHSFHLTISVYQKNSWADFMEKLVPQALKAAIDDDVKFRTGLPLEYLRYAGLAYAKDNNIMQKYMTLNAKKLMKKMIKYIDIDKAADEMAKGHLHDFLPTNIYQDECERSVLQGGRFIEQGQVQRLVTFKPKTKIRLLRHLCARLVKDDEENNYKLYYSTENTLKYHEYDMQYLEIDDEFVPGVKEIIRKYPDFLRVDEIPITGLDNKIQLAKDLWEKQIIITYDRLPHPPCSCFECYKKEMKLIQN